MLLYNLSMQNMCIILVDQCVEWNTCEDHIVINQLNLCGCEWCKYRIYVKGCKYWLHVNGEIIGYEGAELCICDSVFYMDMRYGMGSIPQLWKDC